MVETQLLDYDAKRIHYFHRMYHSEQGYVAATLEQLSLHVDLEARRSCEFAPDVHARITAAANVHAKLSRPKEACSTIGIRHRR